MRLQVLSSGSEGNSTLVRGGETTLLVDAGLARIAMEARLESARVATLGIDHVLVTHGHLDHARSSGMIAKRAHATLHCAETLMTHPSARRAKSLATLRIGSAYELSNRAGQDPIRILAVPLPHDCDPTVAFGLEQGGRRAVILTDMGRPDEAVARALADPHVLVLEFNWDPELMACGPYPEVLRRRITGERGHLSNAQGAQMLRLLAGANLHTLVLAHLSKKTNDPARALAAARAELERAGLGHVRTLIASQEEIGTEIEV
jgi:phosphoribosyl 1,2-cyclic phosphodiesterase